LPGGHQDAEGGGRPGKTRGLDPLPGKESHQRPRNIRPLTVGKHRDQGDLRRHPSETPFSPGGGEIEGNGGAAGRFHAQGHLGGPGPTTCIVSQEGHIDPCGRQAGAKELRRGLIVPVGIENVRTPFQDLQAVESDPAHGGELPAQGSDSS